MSPIRTFDTRVALMRAAAERIAEALQNAVSKHGEACAALSGGSTPAHAYEALSAFDLDWSHVTFALVDERLVPPSDPGSNEALLRRTLAPALGKGAKLLPMYADGMSADEAARQADAAYANRRIDIALMGMGDDGHTASWFPQSAQLEDALDIANPRAVIALDAPGAAGSTSRLTITRAALARAGEIVLLITGEDKRHVLEGRGRTALPVDRLFDLPLKVDVWWSP